MIVFVIVPAFFLFQKKTSDSRHKNMSLCSWVRQAENRNNGNAERRRAEFFCSPRAGNNPRAREGGRERVGRIKGAMASHDELDKGG